MIGAPRLIVALAVGAFLAVSTSAVARDHVLFTTNVRDLAQADLGYTVRDVRYHLNPSDPRNIDSVTFRLDRVRTAGTTLAIKLVAAGTTFYSCAGVGTDITCPTLSPQATVASTDALTVKISDRER